MSSATAGTVGVVVLLLLGVVAAVVLTQRSARQPLPQPAPPPTSPSDDQGRPAPHGGGKSPSASAGTPTGEACVRVPERQRLTVLTYNIHATVGSDGRTHLDTLATEIDHWHPDIVLLQEVDRFQGRSGNVDTPAALADRLGWSWTFGKNLRRHGGSYGDAILTRFPILSSRQYLLPRPPGTEQRGLLHAVLDVNGVQVSAYATHLDQSSPVARLPQARTIVARVDSDPLPVVLGGDLNAHPTSPAVSILRSRLVDTWREVGAGLGRSVPRARIDYLMHRDGRDGPTLAPKQAVVLRSGFSDHNAVWASYELESVGGKVCVPLLPEQTA